MPTIDPTTPAGAQPNGFTGGYTLTMSDEFNSTTLDSKWHNSSDFGNGAATSAWDVNAGNNSALRMWWNGNTSTDNQMFVSTGANPFRQRYGFFEARVKVCRGKGFFPGWWLYPVSNSQGENADGQQPELDITEWFSSENGDWLVDTSSYRCKNAKFTIWTEGGGGSTNEAGERKLSDFGGYRSTISTAFHTYGMQWSQSGGLQYYFDGVAVGTALADPWGTSQNGILLACIMQLWWGPNGGNPTPVAGATPIGPPATTSATDDTPMSWDYVRVWTIGGSPAPSPGPAPAPAPTPAPMTAVLDTAPADGATINGNVFFQIHGDSIANAELLPGAAGVYTPLYGRFTLAPDPAAPTAGIIGTLNWDTTAIVNGSLPVRISAFSSPPGGGGSEIVVMTRTYIINNIAPPAPSPSPTPSPSDLGSQFISSTLHLPRAGRGRR